MESVGVGVWGAGEGGKGRVRGFELMGGGEEGGGRRGRALRLGSWGLGLTGVLGADGELEVGSGLWLAVGAGVMVSG